MHKACELAPLSNPRHGMFEFQHRFVERALRLQPRLLEYIEAKELPDDPDELWALADLCCKSEKRYPVAAVRVYQAAATAQPAVFTTSS